MSCIRLLKVTTGLLDWDFPPWGQLRLMLWRRGGCWPNPPACPEGASGPPLLDSLSRFAPDSIKQGPSPRAREHDEIPFKGLFVQAMPCPSSCSATETPTLPAGLRGSSARRSRGIQLRSVSSTPRSAQTPGAPSPQPRSTATATPLASLLSCFSLEAWKYGHLPLASPRGFSLPSPPVPPAPAPSVTSCCGIRREKGNVFMESLHPIEIFWERSAWTASCHVMNLVHPELRDAPAHPAKGFQSCTPRPRPCLCTLMPPCPCVSLSHPVAPRALTVSAHPSLDL